MEGKLAIATTINHNEDYIPLVLEAMNSIHKLGYKAYIGLNSISSPLKKQLESMKHDVRLSSGNYSVRKRRAVLAAAEENETILYTPPHLMEWIENKLESSIQAFYDNDFDLAFVARNISAHARKKNSFADRCDEFLHSFISEIVGFKGDFTYGPFFMNEKVAKLTNTRGEQNHSYSMFLLGRAHKLEYKIGSIMSGLESENPVELVTADEARKHMNYLFDGFERGLSNI